MNVEEKKVRTIIIDGVEIQTTLSAVEIVDLEIKNKELQKEIEEKSKLINSMKKFLLDIRLMADYLESEEHK